MAAVGHFVAMTPNDLFSADEWRRFGKELVSTAHWMLFSSIEYAQGLNMSDDFMYALIFGVISGIGIILYNVYDPGEAFDYSTDGATSDEMQAEIAKLKEEDEELMEIAKKEAARQLKAEAEQGTTDSSSGEGLRQRKGKGKVKGGEKGGEGVGDGDESKGKGADKNPGGRTDEELYAEAKARVIDAKLAKVDEAAANVKNNEKLRKLLGVNDDELDEVVRKTKSDVRNGVTPSEPTNWSGWFDTFVFLCMGAVLLYFAKKDYGFDAFFWFEQHFPREAKVFKAFSGK